MFTELAAGFSCLFLRHYNNITARRNSVVPNQSKLVQNVTPSSEAGKGEVGNVGEKQAKKSTFVLQDCVSDLVNLFLAGFWRSLASYRSPRSWKARSAARFQVLENCPVQSSAFSPSTDLPPEARDVRKGTLLTHDRRLPYLRPGSSFPLRRARYSVARPAALGAISATVLEMDGAVCTVMKGLNATHGTDLVA